MIMKKTGQKLTESETKKLVDRINKEDYHSLCAPYVLFEDTGMVGGYPLYPTDRKFRVLSMFEFLEGKMPGDKEENP
jgi:hypothetical protein